MCVCVCVCVYLMNDSFFFSLFNSMNMKEFMCRIVHCISLHISVIQVFFHDKMAVVAHLIGVDQLPSEAQVCKKYSIHDVS